MAALHDSCIQPPTAVKLGDTMALPALQTEIGNPAISWTALAQVRGCACTKRAGNGRHARFWIPAVLQTRTKLQGMGVTASRATTCAELATQFMEALERRGPTLIEAAI